MQRMPVVQSSSPGAPSSRSDTHSSHVAVRVGIAVASFLAVVALRGALPDVSSTLGGRRGESSPPVESTVNQPAKATKTPAYPAYLSWEAANITPQRPKLPTCPQWDEGLKWRFRDMCGFWVDAVDSWRKDVKSSASPPVAYVCKDEARCHGIGDRMSGVYTAFDFAINNGRPLKIIWNGIDAIFGPSCAIPKALGWGASNSDREELKHACGMPKGNGFILSTCRDWNSRCPSRSRPMALTNMIRGCASSHTCKSMMEALDKSPKMQGGKYPLPIRGGTVAHHFGCPMRMLFEPRPDFLNMQVQWFQDSESKSRTLRSVVESMRDNFVISMHFRMGDRAFSSKRDIFHVDSRWFKFVPFFKCANTIEKYVEHTGATNGRPIRWMFSSDSPALRDKVRREFGNKVMMLDETPKHVAKQAKQKMNSALAHTMAEWYLLSLGDDLLVNRYKMGPSLFVGRLSGFAKTMWAYSLKHLYYDAGQCMLRTMTIDGSWRPGNRACAKQEYMIDEWNLAQPHLAFGNFKVSQSLIDDRHDFEEEKSKLEGEEGLSADVYDGGDDIDDGSFREHFNLHNDAELDDNDRFHGEGDVEDDEDREYEDDASRGR